MKPNPFAFTPTPRASTTTISMELIRESWQAEKEKYRAQIEREAKGEGYRMLVSERLRAKIEAL